MQQSCKVLVHSHVKCKTGDTYDSFGKGMEQKGKHMMLLMVENPFFVAFGTGRAICVIIEVIVVHLFLSLYAEVN